MKSFVQKIKGAPFIIDIGFSYFIFTFLVDCDTSKYSFDPTWKTVDKETSVQVTTDALAKPDSPKAPLIPLNKLYND